MPKQHLPSPEDFEKFQEMLFERGFRKLSRQEFVSEFRRLKLRAPRPRKGRELALVLYANDYRAVVWTTWLKESQVARKKDSGWVLIAEGNRVLYFSRPIHRTKNFLKNLSMQARIAGWKVRHRLRCPECHNFMHIVRGKALKQRFWQCRLTQLHEDRRRRFKSWDYGLPEEALKYLHPIRKKRVKRYATLRAEGKEPHQAMLARKLWGKGKG